MRPISFIIALLLISYAGNTQESFDERLSTLEVLAERITLDGLEDDKVELNSDFLEGLSSLVRDTHIFNLDLVGLKKYISILGTSDMGVKVFSWQLKHDEDTYEYFGLVVRKEAPNFPIVLDDVSDELPMTDMIELRRADWFGCYYYNMLPHTTEEGEDVYILFGYDSNDRFSNKKIIDVLRMDSVGEVTFGYPIFYHDDGPRYRRVFDIDETSTSRVNYDQELGIIMFNHFVAGGGEDRQEKELVSKSVQVYQVDRGHVKISEIDHSKEIPQPQKDRVLFRPDGSYQGYKLVDGRWIFIDKVFDQILDEAPRPKPIFNTGK